MVVARQRGWPTHGAAERMKIDTKELDESMHGADGVAGDVRGAMCEAVGVRPLMARSECTVHQWHQITGVRQGWQVELR